MRRQRGLGVAALVASAACASVALPPEDGASPGLAAQAAAEISQGDLDRGGLLLAAALAERPDDPVGHFVLACLALETNDWAAGGRAVSFLEGAVPGRGETRVLRNLLARRQAEPRGRWKEAFLRAWKEAGRPDIGADPLLSEEAEPRGRDDEEVWQALSSQASRVAFSIGSNRSRAWIEKELEGIEDPETLCLVAGRLQAKDLSVELRAKLKRQLERVAGRLTASVQLPLLALLVAGPDEGPFSLEEVEALEELAVRERYMETDGTRLFHEAYGALKYAGSADAKSEAFTAFVSTVECGEAWTLSKRAAASAGSLDPAELQRLAQALGTIGELRFRERTALARGVGQLLIRTATGLVSDRERERRSREEHLRLAGLLVEARQASARMGLAHWPLPSLMEALTFEEVSDEIAFLRSIVE